MPGIIKMGRCGTCKQKCCECDNGGCPYIIRTGATGPSGPVGVTGPRGPTGINGPIGAAGSLIFFGSLSSAPSSPPNNSINIDPTTGVVYQYSGIWSQLLSIFGATGPTGPARPISYGNINGTISYPFAGPVPQTLFNFNYTATDIGPKILQTNFSLSVTAPLGVVLTGYTYVDATIYQTSITVPPNITGVQIPFILSRVIVPSLGSHTITTGIVPSGACTVNLGGTNNDVTTYIV